MTNLFNAELLGLSSDRAHVLGAPKAEDREKDDSKKGEAQAEAHAVTETLRQIDANNDANDEVNEWDEHQNDPPAGSAHDLA